MTDECAINRSRTKQSKVSVASRTEPARSAQCGQNVNSQVKLFTIFSNLLFTFSTKEGLNLAWLQTNIQIVQNIEIRLHKADSGAYIHRNSVFNLHLGVRMWVFSHCFWASLHMQDGILGCYLQENKQTNKFDLLMLMGPMWCLHTQQQCFQSSSRRAHVSFFNVAFFNPSLLSEGQKIWGGHIVRWWA